MNHNLDLTHIQKVLISSKIKMQENEYLKINHFEDKYFLMHKHSRFVMVLVVGYLETPKINIIKLVFFVVITSRIIRFISRSKMGVKIRIFFKLLSFGPKCNFQDKRLKIYLKKSENIYPA